MNGGRETIEDAEGRIISSRGDGSPAASALLFLHQARPKHFHLAGRAERSRRWPKTDEVGEGTAKHCEGALGTRNCIGGSEPCNIIILVSPGSPGFGKGDPGDLVTPGAALSPSHHFGRFGDGKTPVLYTLSSRPHFNCGRRRIPVIAIVDLPDETGFSTLTGFRFALQNTRQLAPPV